MADSCFEETDVVPAGRKARVIGNDLWNALADSAKRGVAFSRTAGAEVIDDLRKDLSSAAVRLKYDVTTGSTQLENGEHKLTFSAKAKTPAPVVTETAPNPVAQEAGPPLSLAGGPPPAIPTGKPKTAK